MYSRRVIILTHKVTTNMSKDLFVQYYRLLPECSMEQYKGESVTRTHEYCLYISLENRDGGRVERTFDAKSALINRVVSPIPVGRGAYLWWNAACSVLIAMYVEGPVSASAIL